MIYIGLAGWGDHDTISPKGKLLEYASHFPIVEVDASFYAIQSKTTVEKWIRDTPQSFQFIVKAFQGLTGHDRGKSFFSSKKEMFEAFKESLKPYQKSNKLSMVLFQFPPWFDCSKRNVDYLRYCKEQMEDVPVALEFRHQSWFYPKFQDQTLSFMKEQGWIHSICDEPQVGEGSIPTILKTTNTLKTLVRFHGRNIYGWRKPSQGDWREVRYLYRYNESELLEWKEHLQTLSLTSKDIYTIFNNNSGGDAADNAKAMIDLLSLEYKGLAPRQLDLF